MPFLSVKISEHLNQQLEDKGVELGGLKTSDVVRILLSFAVENYDQKKQTLEKKSLEQLSNYTILTHCLVETFLLRSLEDGQELWDEAQAKSQKLVDNLLGVVSE